MRYLTLIQSFMLLFFSVLQAQEHTPLITDRPDATESAATIAPGYLQLETGFQLKNHDLRKYMFAREQETTTWNTSLLRIGLSPVIELRLGTEVLTESTITFLPGHKEKESEASGFGSVSLGLKLHLVEENGILPELALIAGAEILPLASRELRPDEMSSDLLLAASHTLSEKFSLGYNLGGTFSEFDPEFLSYTLALGYTPGEKFGMFAEIFGNAWNKSEDNDLWLDGGFTYLLLPFLQLDLYGGTTAAKDQDGWFIGGGFSWRFGALTSHQEPAS